MAERELFVDKFKEDHYLRKEFDHVDEKYKNRDINKLTVGSGKDIWWNCSICPEHKSFMKKLYKRIKINHIYKIYSCKELSFKGKDYLGFVAYEQKEVYIKKGKEFLNTLYHELAHIIINESNSKMRSDEKFIIKLSRLIKQIFILKRNI